MIVSEIVWFVASGQCLRMAALTFSMTSSERVAAYAGTTEVIKAIVARMVLDIASLVVIARS